MRDYTAGSGHQSPGLWQHPDDQSWRFDDTEHWVELAKLLEDAKFHGIFIADVLGEPLCLRFNLAETFPTHLHRRLRCVQEIPRASHHLWCTMARDGAALRSACNGCGD
jgi:alkanesulfonate monooxygenase SsuD/methylene tetrahydromethanopterin reductase-like flavin-dependent oxidoreductase (luciferase family)